MEFNLDYFTAIFETFKDVEIMSGIFFFTKALAVLFFLVNIMRKYIEGATEANEGVSFGISPKDIIKNLLFLGLIIFSTQLLTALDALLIPLERLEAGGQHVFLRIPSDTTAQSLEVPNDFPGLMKFMMGQFFGALNIMEGLTTLLMKIAWFVDLFIYPFFLAERFFLLGILQLFFPIVITLAFLDDFRNLAVKFFKLYIAVYLFVPAFLFVNFFVRVVYKSFDRNFVAELWGESVFNSFQFDLIAPAIVLFIIFLKFKLYKKSSSFLLQIFT